MTGGLRFTPEQIRQMPLSIQIQIGLSIAAQLTQSSPVAVQEDNQKEESNAEM